MPKPVRTTRQKRSREIELRALQRAFLRAYAYCGGVTKAAKAIKTSHVHHLRWLAKDPKYAEKFEEAAVAYRVGLLEACEKEIYRRAVEGIDHPIYHKGVKVDSIKKCSDALLMFLTKKLDPNYRENQTQQINVDNRVNIQQTNQIRIVEDGDWYGNSERLASGAADKSGTDSPV